MVGAWLVVVMRWVKGDVAPDMMRRDVTVILPAIFDSKDAAAGVAIFYGLSTRDNISKRVPNIHYYHCYLALPAITIRIYNLQDEGNSSCTTWLWLRQPHFSAYAVR